MNDLLKANEYILLKINELKYKKIRPLSKFLLESAQRNIINRSIES